MKVFGKTTKGSVLVEFDPDEARHLGALFGHEDDVAPKEFLEQADRLLSIQRITGILHRLADAQGMKLVAKESPPTIASLGRVCQFENCQHQATVVNGAGDYLCGRHT